MKNFFTISLCLLLFTSCKKEFAPSQAAGSDISSASNTMAAISSTKATYWDSVFTRYGNGWTGGDAAISYKLPDGRVMWLWGDSFLDTVYPDRHRPIIGFIHNQMTTMNLQGANFTTYYGGTTQNPLPYFNIKGSRYYWPNLAFMNQQKTQVYVFLDKIKATGAGGAFGFKVVGVDVAILNYPDLSIKEIKPFSTGSAINWVGSAWEGDDGYIYIYGAESTKYNKYARVCRTPANDPLSTVTYYNGTTWKSAPEQSGRLLGGLSENFSFFSYQGKYYLLSQENLLGPNIYLYDAASPTGPFTNKRLVYTTPTKVDKWNVITYNATAHPEFITADGKLLVGYCTNEIEKGTGIWKNADTYRPYFVWVSNWQ
ncbi:MAG: DUF5005 domain-containing protein [Panacibacter sp.]